MENYEYTILLFILIVCIHIVFTKYENQFAMDTDDTYKLLS